MNLLLTNDDGYEAEGINVLAKTLAKEHNVYIVAPSGNRSGVSHSITMYKGLTIEQKAHNIYSVSGMPVDCVVTVMRSELLDLKIDAVISGINHGANLGTDIIYSGTCGGAREAVLSGCPSVAFSLEFVDGHISHKAFENMSDFALHNLSKLISIAKTTRPTAFVNVNAYAYDSFKGVKFTDNLALRKYDDKIYLEEKNGKLEASFFCDAIRHPTDDDSDASLTYQGYIAVSLVYSEPLASKLEKDVVFTL